MSRPWTLPVKISGIPSSAYHSQEYADFVSRTYVHSVLRGDGESQLWLDKGRSLWNGNSATSLGSAFDDFITGVLDGKRPEDMIVIPPAEVLDASGGRRGGKYKAWAAEQTGVICTPELKEQFDYMLNSMLRHDAVAMLMRRTIETQPSVFFEINGNKCKVRPDACTDAIWWDLKTTSHGWDRIYRSVIDYGYDLQAAFFELGMEALGMTPARVPFVFVQTVPPYGCRSYVLPEEMVANAKTKLRSALEQIRLRRSTGNYLPEEANEIQELEIPAWALRMEEEVLI